MKITVAARVHREGRFYVIDVSGYGVTQATDPESIIGTAQDYVACLAGVDAGQVEVDLQ